MERKVVDFKHFIKIGMDTVESVKKLSELGDEEKEIRLLTKQITLLKGSGHFQELIHYMFKLIDYCDKLKHDKKFDNIE